MSEEKNFDKNKYSKLLNNLLAIKGKDSAIFTKINNIDSFDIYSKFGSKIALKILNRKEFTLNLEETDLESLLKTINKASDGQEVIDAFDWYKEKLSSSKRTLLKNPKSFQLTLNELIDNIKLKIQKTNSRWTSFRRKVIDANTQDNIWSLHIATCFISIVMPRREIYAPLFLKEVNIKIKDSKVSISTLDDSYKINEKIVFLLNDAGFKICEDINLKKLSIDDCLKIVSDIFSISPIKNKENLFGEFINITSKSIKNKNIIFHPGLVLGLFKPSGGMLRKTMMDIIENDEIDDIVDVEPNKNIYKDKLIASLKNSSDEIVKIQPSNYSQDKALASALIQDTIIWGPPGTGKSQVIANIIANILYKEKSAIVMSQKKAALNVLKERSRGLAPFMLFILNDNKMKKTDFYKPLQNFIDLIDNSEITDRKITNEKIVSDKETEALEIINRAKESGEYTYALQALEILKDFDELFIKNFFNINLMFNYVSKAPDNNHDYLINMAELNDIKKHGLIFRRWPSEFKKAALLAKPLINSLELKLNDYETIIKKTTSDVVLNLMSVPKKLVRDNKYVSNEKYLIKILSGRILNKLEDWKQTKDKEKIRRYKSFSAAIRAARALPYKFIDKHQQTIKELFPLIITTPETSFLNWEKESFDYVIVDESSQIYLEVGLPIIYLGKIKVFAGDQQQMQPSRWFSTRDDTEETDEDIIENADSLLDYALDKGVFKIMLNQNFRSSSASLMSFSSKQFYESKLEVIDQAKFHSNNPIEVIEVDGKWEKGTNLVEVNKVINLALKAIKKYEKVIILTFNSPQRQLIEKIIIENYPTLFTAIENEELSVRNIENIQGDEADIVIISVVYDETTNIGSTYVARPGGQNALNVAISRARDKMIVVKTVKSSKIKSAKSSDFSVFKNWLHFLELDQKTQTTYSIPQYDIEESYGETESGFEVDVIKVIKDNIKTNEKVKLIKQYPVGSKRIDIALLDVNDRYLIGIEVDGYKYHMGKGFDQYLADNSRQEFLENKGYDIFRITEIDWKINQPKILKNLKFLIESKLKK